MNLSEAITWVRGLRDRMAGLLPASIIRAVVPPILANDIRSNFEGSHSPEGAPWPPIFYRPGKPLIKTGELMRMSIAAVANPHVEDGLLRATQEDPFYGIFHQIGAGVKKRRFFGLSDEALEYIEEDVGKQAVVYVLYGRGA